MPRRKGNGMPVPEGVHAVRSGKKTYYYWAPNRGTDFATKPVPLGTDHTDPEFWKKLEAARGDDGDAVAAGSFKALIAAYKKSPKFTKRRPRTRDHYTRQIEIIAETWGKLQVKDLTVAGILALRATKEKTPVAANHLLSMLRTLLGWGLTHGYGERNPANDIEPLEIDDVESAKPWPEWAFRRILQIAPERLYRAVYLGRACGQRRADLVLFGKRHRKADGIAIKIGKLRDKEHIIPLMKDQLAEIDAWSCSDTGAWVQAVRGGRMTGDNLQSTLNRLTKATPELKGITLKLHGLRAMAAIDRKMIGEENRAIGASLCMTTQTVERYIKHIDTLALARRVRDGLERGGNEIVKSFPRRL